MTTQATWTPFTPKGEEAMWKPIYRLFRDAEVGTVLTYEDIQAFTGWDVRENRAPLYQAQRKMEQQLRRTIDNVSGVGYKVLSAPEHEGAAKKHHKRHRRQLTKAKRKLTSARREELDSEQVARFDRLESELGRQIDMTRRLEGRVLKVERAVEAKADSAVVVDQDARLSRLEEMLARMERRDG